MYDLSSLDGAFKEILEVVYTNSDALYYRINPCSPINKFNEGCVANCCYRVGTASNELDVLISAAGPRNAVSRPEDAPAKGDEGTAKNAALAEAADSLVEYKRPVHWDNCGKNIHWEPLPYDPFSHGKERVGVMQRYTGGVQSMLCTEPDSVEMTIEFECDYGAGKGQPTTARDFEKAARMCKYHFLWKTDAVCPARISSGWIFVIVVLCTAVVYLGGGFAYNVKVRGMEPSAEAIPNKTFWTQDLPELVKEGCAYFLVLVEEAKDKWQGKDSYETLEENDS